MIFQKDAGFKLTAPLDTRGEGEDEGYAHIFMGEAYGILGNAAA